MLLEFPSDKSIEMTFKVGIAGTQTAPTNVAVVLERAGQSLSYTAAKSGDDWVANIDSPGKTFGTGEVKMCVNVLLNNRLFTPLKSMANIVGESAEQVKHDEPPVKLDEPQVPKAEIEPAPVAPPVSMEEVEEVVEAKPAPKPVVSDEDKRKKVKELLSTARDAADKKKAETVKATPPIRMQLLKSVEPGVKKATPAPVKEAKTVAKNHDIFSLKKTKIIYQ